MPKSITVTLETVTPLFLGGAEPRPITGGKEIEGMPELRPPAFRGAMRYWLRALLGGIHGNGKQDLEKVKEIESTTFGSAADNKSSMASAITLRITNPNIGQLKKYEKIKDNRGKALRPPAGRDYLYWSLDRSGSFEKKNLLEARYYIPPESTFDLVLNVRAGTENADKIKQYAINSLWLAVQLGGFGARSRRTAGSLTTHASELWNESPFKLTIGTKTDVASQLGEALSKIRKGISEGLSSPNIITPSPFDTLHPKTCKIWVVGISKSSDGIVKAIGERFQSFRSKTPTNMNKDTWLLERSIFGLPIKGLSGIERRASPLWLKISQIDGYFVGIATLFQSQLLPQNEKIKYKDSTGRMRSESPEANFKIVEDWVNEFDESVEVSYD